jgi:preprotein translocase SecE subunit
VARDRKRAKQRRDRRGSAADPGARKGADAQGSSPGDGLRADVPGALGHASAEVDEFDAALLRGAGGVPADTGPELGELAGAGTAEQTLPATEQARPGTGSTLPDTSDAGDDLLQAPGGPGGNGDAGAGAGAGGGGRGGGDAHPERPSGAPLRPGNRAISFVRASWAELQRVQWPDRRQVTQATAVVLGFVAIAGAYLGLADFVAKEIVEFIL